MHMSHWLATSVVLPQARVAECNDDDVEDEEKQRRLAVLKQHSYMFQSYDPAITKMYTERYPWIGAINKAILCARGRRPCLLSLHFCSSGG